MAYRVFRATAVAINKSPKPVKSDGGPFLPRINIIFNIVFTIAIDILYVQVLRSPEESVYKRPFS